MPVIDYAVSVGTTATLLSGAAALGTESQQFSFTNNDATATLYVGGPTVTTTTGTPVLAGQPIGANLSNVVDELYGVVASGAVDVRVLVVSGR